MKKLPLTYAKDSGLRTLSVNLDGIKRRQQARIRELEEKEKSYLESPAMTFKLLALELLKDGDIEKGAEFIEEALKIDNTIFYDCECISVNCRDIEKFSRINPLLPRAALIPIQPISEADKTHGRNIIKIVRLNY